MDIYTNRVKYPKTAHLPFSPGLQNDDRVIETLNGFVGHEIVATEKMDGENATLAKDYYHARSLDSRHHQSRNWIKSFHGEISYQIPHGWRICGENMYAEHTIPYDQLESYFYGFSIWDEYNFALSWDETLRWFAKLNITPAPVLYRGAFNIDVLKKLAVSLDVEKQEGFVIRVVDEFDFKDFETKTAKWVRKGHVQTAAHWMHQEVIPNKLKCST